MSIRIANAHHEVAYQDICKLMSKHADKLSAEELLAVAANMLGKMIAVQDQRVMTPKMALEIVTRNMERGAHQALDQLLKDM